MKIYEFFLEKKSKEEKIIINFPDKQDLPFLKILSGSLYYSNTKTVIMKKSDINIYQLKRKDYKEYIENEISSFLEGYIENNYIYIKCDYLSQYHYMKKYTFVDSSECYNFGRFDAKRIKRVFFWQLENDYLKIPIGFKNDFQNLEDRRLKRKWKFENIKDCLGYLELYDEQVQAIKTMLNNINGIIKAPTGSGKTEIFISFLKLTKLKSLILTTSIDLARQTYKRILKSNLDCGLVQGEIIDEDHQIIIATVQSSHKITKKFECVIIDEVHEVSDIHKNILSDKDVLYRYGFSGTPLVKDKLKNAIIQQFIGDIIFEIKSETLQKENKIAIPFINMIKINNTNLNKLENEKNWKLVEQFFIIQNQERNKKIIDLCKKIDTQRIILCKRIQHGEILQTMLKEEGINCIFLQGNTKKEEREKVLKEYDLNKNNFVLIGSKILFTGINLQNIFNLFYVAGGKSNIEVLQSLGRALRSKTKLTVNVYDFYDMNNLIVENHSKERISLYKKEGFNNINIIK